MLTTAKTHYNLQLDIFKQQINNFHITKNNGVALKETYDHIEASLKTRRDKRASEMQLHIFTTLGPVMHERHYYGLMSWARLNTLLATPTGQQIHIHIFTNMDTTWQDSREKFNNFVKSLGCATEHKMSEDGVTSDTFKLPYMNTLFAQIIEAVPPQISNGYDNVVFAYLNADIFITESLLHSIRSVHLQKPERFLLVSRRWNLDPEHITDSMNNLNSPTFDEQTVYDAVYKHGDLFMDRAIDLVAFNRKLFGDDPLQTIPPFIMAAPYWDNWTLQFAKSQEDCLAIDATQFVMIVHLNHNSHRFASHMSSYLVRNFKTAKGYIWPLTNSGSTDALPYEMFGSTPGIQCPCIAKRQ
jgi:hypothetical protein